MLSTVALVVDLVTPGLPSCGLRQHARALRWSPRRPRLPPAHESCPLVALAVVCAPGGIWYYVGRRFGIDPASPDDPYVRIELEASVEDDEVSLWVQASVVEDDRKLPKEQRRHILRVIQGEDIKTTICPRAGDAASC
jgi:hypothetical protein